MDENPYLSPTVPDPQRSSVATPSDGKHCPACGEDIGLRPYMRLWYYQQPIICPHCRARLTTDHAAVAAIPAIKTVGFVFGIPNAVRSLIYDRSWELALIAIGVALLVVVVGIWLTALRLRQRGTLRME